MEIEQGRTGSEIGMANIATPASDLVPIAHSNSSALRTENTLYQQGESAEQREHLKTLAAEKIFDASVYGVWNYGLQVGASVAAAMWFRDGSGRPYFEKSAEWMGEHVMQHITSKKGAAAAEQSHTWLLFGALITVGNLFIPPMHYAEKHKAEYVSKINDWLNQRRTQKGDAPSAEELAEQQRQIRHIAEEPVQSASSLWAGRALGLGANFLASHLVGEANNKAMQHAVSEGVSHGLNKVGMKTLAESPAMKSMTQIAFMDYGYSILSSNIVYLYSHMLHPKPKAEKQPQIHPDSHIAQAHIQATVPTPALQMGGVA